MLIVLLCYKFSNSGDTCHISTGTRSKEQKYRMEEREGKVDGAGYKVQEMRNKEGHKVQGARFEEQRQGTRHEVRGSK